MLSRKRKLLLALSAGFIVTAIAALPFPFFEILLTPGVLFSALFWPQGIHSGSGLGTMGFILFVSCIWIGNFLFWSGITYASMALIAKLRAA